MTFDELAAHLLQRLHEVQERLGLTPSPPDASFADAVDSMGLVEFVGVVATDCAVGPERIEESVGRRFSTLTDLTRALHAARIVPRRQVKQEKLEFAEETAPVRAWLASWTVRQPSGIQWADEIDSLLGRPPGWLEQHAGIQSRWLWRAEDPLDIAAGAAMDCLASSATTRLRPAALLVTSEAPPRAIGVAADLHGRLSLPTRVPALEIGGACTGLLHRLYLAQRLVRRTAPVVIIAVEAPSRYLRLEPGLHGENAALFGDCAAACRLHAELPSGQAYPLRDILLGCDGTAADLVRVDLAGAPGIRMDGPALALRAVQQLAEVVHQICERNDVPLTDLAAVYIHAGNGRMRPLVARQLGIPDERVISTTPFSGNLGSVSLLAAMNAFRGNGPIVWAAVGAGLCWGAALFGAPASG